jgi:hypothetical protein
LGCGAAPLVQASSQIEHAMWELRSLFFYHVTKPSKIQSSSKISDLRNVWPLLSKQLAAVTPKSIQASTSPPKVLSKPGKNSPAGSQSNEACLLVGRAIEQSQFHLSHHLHSVCSCRFCPRIGMHHLRKILTGEGAANKAKGQISVIIAANGAATYFSVTIINRLSDYPIVELGIILRLCLSSARRYKRHRCDWSCLLFHVCSMRVARESRTSRLFYVFCAWQPTTTRPKTTRISRSPDRWQGDMSDIDGW